MTVRHPPGRAGRIWLRDRLETARHGAELLERKREVLARERRRLAALADRTAEDWKRSAGATGPATLRLLLSGGRAALERTGHDMPPARAEVEWTSAMNVTYPGHITLRLGEAPPETGPAALGPAIAAHRAALEAAVQQAAATAALRRIDAELATTGQRLRGVRDRLIPRLEDALADLEVRLDESEREEIVRTRWAHRRATGADREGATP